MGPVNTHDSDEPRWLRLAATLHAEPDPTTLARVRARLAARREQTPAWIAWFAKPASLAVAAGLLVASVMFGVTWLRSTVADSAREDAALASVWSDEGETLGLGSANHETGSAVVDTPRSGR